MTRRAADFAVVDGLIWTGCGPDVAALAAAEGRVVAIGRNADIADMISPRTSVLRACGRRVVPGLIDAHLHFIPGGLRLGQLDLSGVPDPAALVDAVRRRAAALPHGAWVLGGGWSDDHWPGGAVLHLEQLDAACDGRPCLLLRMDCHAALVNSVALALAGIDRHGPPDPPGGRIDRDAATGEPTGIVRDSAMEVVRRRAAPPTDGQRREALQAATQAAWRAGLTMVHNMLDPPDADVVIETARSGQLGVRMYAILHRRPQPDAIRRCREAPVMAEGFRIGACKNYMDGSLGSRTAWMLHPYAEPSAGPPCGLRVDGGEPDDDLLAEFLAADRAGLQLVTHAIGDAANRELVGLYLEVARRAGWRDRRPRVEHAQHLDAADVPRFAAAQAVASMQPLHKFEDGLFAEQALGAERAAGSYRFRDLLDSGVVLAFGSDWPIVTINPWSGMRAAVTGRVRGGRTWLAEQNLSVREALRAYTWGAAYACHAEDRLGLLIPGYCADLVVLDRDPFAIDPTELGDVQPVATVVGGRVVHALA